MFYKVINLYKDILYLLKSKYIIHKHAINKIKIHIIHDNYDKIVLVTKYKHSIINVNKLSKDTYTNPMQCIYHKYIGNYDRMRLSHPILIATRSYDIILTSKFTSNILEITYSLASDKTIYKTIRKRISNNYYRHLAKHSSIERERIIEELVERKFSRLI